MSRSIQVLLVDDIDGTEADEKVQFALDGVAYEIDLSEANARALRDTLAPWIAAGRRAGSIRHSVPRPRSGSGTGSGREIRDWAREHGMPVGTRGRLSREVTERYQQETSAHAR